MIDVSENFSLFIYLTMGNVNVGVDADSMLLSERQ
jgi:hypothetical protein